MTNEEIIEMAKQTHIPQWCGTDDHEFVVELLAFARLIEQATREADGKTCDELKHYFGYQCAEAIRSQK